MDRNAVKSVASGIHPSREWTVKRKRFFPQFLPQSDTHISQWLEKSPKELDEQLVKILTEKTISFDNMLEELKLKPLRVPMEMSTGRKIKKLRLW
jgi:hypothetical protein